MNKFINIFKKLNKYLEKSTKQSKKQESKWNTEKEIEKLEKMENTLKPKDGTLLEKWEKYSTKFIFKFWLIGALVVYVSFLLFKSLELIYMIFAAYIISIALESIILFFEKKARMPRGIAILVSYILAFAFLTSWFLLIIPFVLNQTWEIITTLVHQISWFQKILEEQGLKEMINSISFLPMKNLIIWYVSNEAFMNSLQSYLQQNINSIVSFGTTITKDFGNIVVNIIKMLIATIYNIVVITVMSIFFSLEKDWVINLIASLTWSSEYVSLKLKKLYLKLWYWLKWQLVLSLFIWSMVFVMLYSLTFFGIDLPYKFTLSLIAWITEFVPYVWPILGALPALLVAFPNYWIFGVAVVWAAYYLIQFAEWHILVPRIMNIALGISPLLIFIAMIEWWIVMWFIWIVLAVPLAVVINLGFEDFIIKNKK